MAGVKGRSGGKRPGAGRPKKGAASKVVTVATPARPKAKAAPAPKNPVVAKNDPVVTPDAADATPPATTYDDPVEFLLTAMNNPLLDMNLRVRAALSAAQYKNKKVHDGGKKEEQAGAAKSAAGGRYAPSAPPPRPTLVANSR